MITLISDLQGLCKPLYCNNHPDQLIQSHLSYYCFEFLIAYWLCTWTRTFISCVFIHILAWLYHIVLSMHMVQLKGNITSFHQLQLSSESFIRLCPVNLLLSIITWKTHNVYLSHIAWLVEALLPVWPVP